MSVLSKMENLRELRLFQLNSCIFFDDITLNYERLVPISWLQTLHFTFSGKKAFTFETSYPYENSDNFEFTFTLLAHLFPNIEELAFGIYLFEYPLRYFSTANFMEQQEKKALDADFPKWWCKDLKQYLKHFVSLRKTTFYDSYNSKDEFIRESRQNALGNYDDYSDDDHYDRYDYYDRSDSSGRGLRIVDPDGSGEWQYNSDWLLDDPDY